MLDVGCQILDVRFMNNSWGHINYSDKWQIINLTSHILHFHLVQSAHLVTELLTVVVEQRVGDRLQVAGNHLVEIMHREANAVIGHPILREIVGANAFATIARANEALSLGRPFGLLFLQFEIVNAGSQFAERLILVFELAFFVLALHDDTRFKVR